MEKIIQQDIEALIELFERSDWRELHIQGEGIDLFVSKDVEARRAEPAASAAPALLAAPAAPAAKPVGTDAVPAGASDVPAGWIVVRAPSLGTFYRAPKPGAPMLTDIGASVDAESELCLIEVMKLFTTMRAGIAGTVRQIYAKDSELVEFDQPLFLIEPHG
jgi:acetyl-CoA carboxylase biotin carboxyl carrier protein